MAIQRSTQDGAMMFESDFEQLYTTIKSTLCWIGSFKIGRTDKSVAEQFAQPGHTGVYDGICQLYVTPSEELASRMEAALVNEFQNTVQCENSKVECANQNDSIPSSNQYVIYIVYKYERK